MVVAVRCRQGKMRGLSERSYLTELVAVAAHCSLEEKYLA